MPCRFDAPIKSGLADTPASKWLCGVSAKHERPITFAAIENGAYSRYDRNAMPAVVLGSLRRQYNLIASDLGPTQRADFVATAAGQANNLMIAQ